MRRQIEHLNSCRRFGTARNYLRAMNSLSRYLGGEDLPIRALYESLVEGYGAFLRQRGVVRNSISFYMRILRSVYNKAASGRAVLSVPQRLYGHRPHVETGGR